MRILFRTRHRNRRAYFYVPPSEAARFRDDGTQAFPPAGAQLLAQNEDTNFTLSLPTDKTTYAQLLIDSRTAARPHPSEHIWLKDGVGMVQFHFSGMANTATGDSAEWGLPQGWTASGAWRVVDAVNDGPFCGSAFHGRKAFAFNRYDTCTYESESGPGLLTMPATYLPCAGRPGLTFWHWSRTERSAYKDRRRVNLSVDDGPFFNIYDAGAQDIGSFDDWQLKHLDLSAYRGRKVQVQFEFNPVDGTNNAHSGWYIDNIQVR